MLGPFTLPPRLALRALDDLHTLARAAAFVMDRWEDVEDVRDRLDALVTMAGRIEELDTRAAGVLARLTSLDETAADVQELIEQVNGRAQGVLDVASRIEAELPALDRMLGSVDLLGTAATTMAQAVEPLQGVTERLGRIADRLPGGGRIRPRG